VLAIVIIFGDAMLIFVQAKMFAFLNKITGKVNVSFLPMPA
jgi:hypothetical protein